MRIAVIGVPWNSSGGTDGEAGAPRALRRAGLVELLAGVEDVSDFGDVVFPAPTPVRDATTGMIAPRELAQMVLATRAATARALAVDQFPLVIGGDCAFLLGCLAAARDAFGRVGLLMVDGHEDAYPPRASTTGEVADMELGLALGRNLPPGLPELTGHLPVVAAEDVVVIGARDGEELREEGVRSIEGEVAVFDDEEVRAQGVAATIDGWTKRLAGSAETWWFHLDLDALSTGAMPAVRYRQAGGFDWAETTTIARGTLGAPGCAGWSLADYNPDLDPSRMSARRIVETLADVVRATSAG
jgi:arginase